LGWLVFVELPVEEAYASIYDSIKRSGAILFVGLVLAFLSGLFLARHMVVPIQILRAGAQRIGGSDWRARSLDGAGEGSQVWPECRHRR
jgi:two-component system NtrC family sensor kinase